MYKIKTHSGAKKRFKITSKGKILRARTNKRHNLNSGLKNRKRKRRLRQITTVDFTNSANIKKLIPYK